MNGDRRRSPHYSPNQANDQNRVQNSREIDMTEQSLDCLFAYGPIVVYK